MDQRELELGPVAATRAASAAAGQAAAVLVSPALAFSRDGRTVVALDDAGAVIRDVARGGVVRVDAAAPIAAIAFADQVWIAHGTAPVCARWTRDGRVIDSIALPAAATAAA